MHIQDSKQTVATIQPRSQLKTGAIYFTPGVRENIPMDVIVGCLKRHASCDWGDVCEEDHEVNDQAYRNDCQRILSSYNLMDLLPGGPDKLWIITEADRSSTTMLLPDEY